MAIALPWISTESSTTRQVMVNSRSAPGIPANTGSSTSSSEESPRGPNSAMSRQLPGSMPERRSTGISTTPRMPSATAAKASTRQSPARVTPVQMSPAPNATKVSSRNISADASP